MKSRLALITALVLGAAAVPAMGQNPNMPMGGMGQGQGRGQMGARRLERLRTGITLTPVQQAKVDSIQKVDQAKMPAFPPGQMPDSASRAQRMTLMQEQDAAIRGVLTAEQQAIWDKNVADMRQMMRRPPGN